MEDGEMRRAKYYPVEKDILLQQYGDPHKVLAKIEDFYLFDKYFIIIHWKCPITKMEKGSHPDDDYRVIPEGNSYCDWCGKEIPDLLLFVQKMAR
ncbi:MAG: hypothetical protein ACXABY_17730 [Candidatus Thorarchaeota archaeon]|jgi:hypothetical protein